MNLKSMLKNVRGIIEQPGLGYFTPGDIVDAINESTHYLEAIMKDARKEGYLGDFADMGFSPTVGYVELPVTAQHITGVQITCVAGMPFAKKGIFEEGIIRQITSSDSVGGGPTGFVYDTFGRKLYISPSTPTTIRVYYIRDSIDMLMGLTPVIAPQSDQFPLPVTEDDSIGQQPAEMIAEYYNNFYFQITGGPNGTVSPHQNKILQITGYNPSNVLAYVNPPISSPLIAAGTEFAFIPRVPQQAHRLICLHAGIGLRMQKDEPYQHLHQHFHEQLDQFISSIEDFIQEPEEVEPYDAEFGYL